MNHPDITEHQPQRGEELVSLTGSERLRFLWYRLRLHLGLAPRRARRWLALCVVPFLVAACASPSSFPDAPVRSPDPQPFNVTIYSVGTSNGPDLPVNATGVISGHGFVRLDYSREHPSDDLISLSRGTIVIRRSAGITGVQWLNSATCVSSRYRVATFAVLSGTQSYAGIRGSGNVRVVSVTRTALCRPSVKVSFRPQTVVIIGGSLSLG